MRYKYYCLDHDETIDEAVDVTYNRYDWKNSRTLKEHEFAEDDHENVADSAAKLHYERSVPDWNEGTQTLVIVDENGVEKTFTVTLEHEPSFGISEKK